MANNGLLPARHQAAKACYMHGWPWHAATGPCEHHATMAYDVHGQPPVGLVLGKTTFFCATRFNSFLIALMGH